MKTFSARILIFLTLSTAVAAQTPLHVPGKADPHEQCMWISAGHAEFAPLEKACEAAVEGYDRLPNFVCDLKVTRSQQVGTLTGQPVLSKSHITAQLRFVDGQEQMENIVIDGKAASQPDEGWWSSGEFSPPGLIVFTGVDSPRFSRHGEQKIAGSESLVFDYDIDKEHARSWIWTVPKFGRYTPPFHGSVWIDKEAGFVRQLTMEADDIDPRVGYSKETVLTTYQKVQFSGLGEYVLPIKAESTNCPRGWKQCLQLTREFSNCRKFAAKARIVE